MQDRKSSKRFDDTKFSSLTETFELFCLQDIVDIYLTETKRLFHFKQGKIFSPVLREESIRVLWCQDAALC